MSLVMATFHPQQLAGNIHIQLIIHLQQGFDTCYPSDQKLLSWHFNCTAALYTRNYSKCFKLARFNAGITPHGSKSRVPVML